MTNQLLDDVKYFRKTLHQIPELDFDLPKTHAFVKECLRSWGYTIEVVAHTGIIAVKHGKLPSSIAFRADMDALPVTEQSDYPYPSLHEGRMHACGHDGHMSMLLGFAKELSKRNDLNKGVVLIFQPAEETNGGADPIVKAGILEKYNVEAVFGYHLFPGIPEEKIGLVSGPLMATPAELDLTIRGKSAHGAEPHKGVDAILVASHFIQSIQTIVSRTLDPLEPSVITIGKINGGEARSIIPGEVKLSGTIRTFSEETAQQIELRLETIVRSLELMYGVEIDMVIRSLYPPVINHEGLTQLVGHILSDEEKHPLKPMMLAEDFSYYQKAVPGLFMMLGSRNEEMGYIHPLHSCYFNFDEKILLKGIETNFRICEALEVFENH